MEEMIVIIETLDSIEGVKPGEEMEKEKEMLEGVIQYDESGNPQKIASTRQRAEEIFKVRKSFKQQKFVKSKSYNMPGSQAIDKDIGEELDEEEFMEAYSRWKLLLLQELNAVVVNC